MRLDRFCKLVGVLMLLFLSFPVLWTIAGMYFLGNDMAVLMRGMDEIAGTKSNSSPSQFSQFMTISMIGYFFVVTGLAFDLFLKRNWLSWIIRGLSNNPKKLQLTEIVIEPDFEPAEPTAQPIKPVVQEKKEEVYQNPDEKYMPPQYRSNK